MNRLTPKIFKDKTTNVYFSLEHPYIEIIGIQSNYTLNELKDLDIHIIIKIISNDEKLNEEQKFELSFDFDDKTGNYVANDNVLKLNKETKRVLVNYTIENNKNFSFSKGDLYFNLEYQLIDRIKSENQHELFKKHLSESDNLKIMFSAPFGHGKSTFLEYFFKDEAEQYDVFKLTPINYSVASNEDIFKYIKSDILTQLMGEGLDYKSNKTSHFNSLFQFSKDNLERILVPFLLTVPHIGKSLYSVTKDILKLKDEYFEFHDASNESEFDKVAEFIEELYEKEGSIYEDNFYSQLIRQLLEILKLKTSKQSVLIIDDLDRMDPEHIFRILNVLSVHFDSFNFEEIEIHNKFGFDKIILVCDYENIRKIFEHKYGIGVDFGGYINKYFSKEVYPFNYKDEVKHLLENIDNVQLLDNDIYSAFFNLTQAMFYSNILSLRDIYKIKSVGLNTIHNKLLNANIKYNNLFYFGLYSPTIAILVDTLGYSVFKNKIESLNDIYLLNRMLNLKHSCTQLIGSLQNTSNKIKEYSFDGYTHFFSVDEYQGKLYFNGEYQMLNNESQEYLSYNEFKWDNIYLKKLLLENIEEYKALKMSI